MFYLWPFNDNAAQRPFHRMIVLNEIRRYAIIPLNIAWTKNLPSWKPVLMWTSSQLLKLIFFPTDITCILKIVRREIAYLPWNRYIFHRPRVKVRKRLESKYWPTKETIESKKKERESEWKRGIFTFRNILKLYTNVFLMLFSY